MQKAADTYAIDKKLKDETPSAAILETLEIWISQSDLGEATLDKLINIFNDADHKDIARMQNYK